jgi:phage gp36-like protein
MTYATQTHLEDAFGAVEIRQIADRDGSGAADAAAIEAVLTRADAMIDGYLAGRYALPLVASPPAIIATACDLARYWLYDDDVPEQVRKRFEDALRWLNDVAKGNVLLQLTAATADASTIGSPEFSAPTRVWDATTLAGY